MRLNLPITGFIIGLLLPLLGMYIMYLLWGRHESASEFFSALSHRSGMAAKVVLLGVLINLAPFTYFNLKRLDYALRGVFMATMLYALVIIFLMFVW